MRQTRHQAVMRLSVRLFLPIIVLALISIPAHADWADWWRTPEQQAKAALESGDVETLQRVAPNATWQGIAEHESGDFESAARSFDSVARQHQVDGDARAANRALYNQGVSEVKAGQYNEAVQTFDRVLEQDPQFDDALHNRNIAQQLIQQQEQQQQQQSDEGEGDSSSQDGEQQPSDESGEPSSDAENDDQAESGEPSESEQGDAGEQSGEEGGNEEPDSQSQAAADEQAAKDALEAEAQAQAADQGGDESDVDTQTSAAAGQEQPMSESDQATEQWLRRIPDDPAGLLRRKLEQSHRTDYPQVRDSGEPW